MSGVSENFADNRPDYAKWLRKDFWAVNDAACLIRDIDPSNRDDLILNSKQFERQYLDDLDTVQIAEGNSLQIASLPTHGNGQSIDYAEVEPIVFIQWADSKGYDIPEPFKPLLKEATSDIPSDSLTALRESYYWQTLEKNAIQAIENFPEWKKTQKKIQLTGNLKYWLEENITDNAREIEIIKNVLSEIFKINK